MRWLQAEALIEAGRLFDPLTSGDGHILIDHRARTFSTSFGLEGSGGFASGFPALTHSPCSKHVTSFSSSGSVLLGDGELVVALGPAHGGVVMQLAPGRYGRAVHRWVLSLDQLKDDIGVVLPSDTGYFFVEASGRVHPKRRLRHERAPLRLDTSRVEDHGTGSGRASRGS